MKFSDITSAIHEVWQFCWPPVVACLITLVIVRFLYPTGIIDLTSHISKSSIDYGQSVSKLKEILDPFELTKLVPFMSLVLLILLLYVINMFVMVFSSRFPPHLSYQPDVLLWDRLSEQDKLVLFRKYPTARNFNDAYYMAVQENENKKNETSFIRTESYYKFHNFVKFAMIVSLITFVIAIRGGHLSIGLFGRLLTMIIVLTLLWLFGLIGLLYQQEQEFSHKWSLIRLDLQGQAAELLEKPKTDDENEKLKEAVGGRWWRISFTNSYGILWIRHTLFKRRGEDAR